MSSLISSLKERYSVHDFTPELEAHLAQSSRRIYIGIDPTADSLHVGHLTTLMLLRKLQQRGHQPVVVVGGATGMIGDPSFKAKERKLLDLSILRHNQAKLSDQIVLFFERGSDASLPKALIYNNDDFYANMGILSFLREAGKHISVNYLLAKEAIKQRLKSGISYIEFTYPLIQAYDFYHLYLHHGVTVQIGGSDQWGNLTTGIELIRRKLQKEAHALTIPLLTKSDGSKFGKSEEGENIWLDSIKTSPYNFYQFWLNRSDPEAAELLYRLSDLTIESIAVLIKNHQRAAHKRALQHQLAAELTQLVHGEKALKQADEITHLLFGQMKAATLKQLSLEQWKTLEEALPTMMISEQEITQWKQSSNILYSLIKVGFLSSYREARSLLAAGALSYNLLPLQPLDTIDIKASLLHNQYLLFKKGKKKHLLLKVRIA